MLFMSTNSNFEAEFFVWLFANFYSTPVTSLLKSREVILLLGPWLSFRDIFDALKWKNDNYNCCSYFNRSVEIYEIGHLSPMRWSKQVLNLLEPVLLDPTNLFRLSGFDLDSHRRNFAFRCPKRLKWYTDQAGAQPGKRNFDLSRTE